MRAVPDRRGSRRPGSPSWPRTRPPEWPSPRVAQAREERRPAHLGGRHVLLNGIENSLRRGRLRVGRGTAVADGRIPRMVVDFRMRGGLLLCGIVGGFLPECTHRQLDVWLAVTARYETTNIPRNRIRCAQTQLWQPNGRTYGWPPSKSAIWQPAGSRGDPRTARSPPRMWNGGTRWPAARRSTAPASGRRSRCIAGRCTSLPQPVLQSLDATRHGTSWTSAAYGHGGRRQALHAGGTQVTSIDRHPWAVDEARLTYGDLGLPGQARLGDASRLPVTRGAEAPDALVFRYVLNELPVETRTAVETHLLERDRRLVDPHPGAHFQGDCAVVGPHGQAFAGVRGQVDSGSFSRRCSTSGAARQGRGLNYRELRLRRASRAGR